MSLDLANTNIGYRLGRLFAALEKTQEDANPGLNATIRDRFYGAASSTPVAVFPTLLKLSKHHLAKIENRGWAITLEQLDHEVVELARTSIRTQPAEIFGELVRVRDRVFQMLGRRAHPAQQSHLYLLAGKTCGLLANASMELGCYGAAAEQSRAAWVYAEIIGHNGLKGWLRGTQSLIVFCSGNPREAAHLAKAGREHVRHGTGFVRLCNIESRAWAHLGDVRETQKVIGMGHQAREHGTEPDDLHDLVGGEFGFDEARQSFCNAGAWVQVGKPALAIEAAERALRLYATDAERNRRYGGEASTRLEMT